MSIRTATKASAKSTTAALSRFRSVLLATPTVEHTVDATLQPAAITHTVDAVLTHQGLEIDHTVDAWIVDDFAMYVTVVVGFEIIVTTAGIESEKVKTGFDTITTAIGFNTIVVETGDKAKGPVEGRHKIG